MVQLHTFYSPLYIATYSYIAMHITGSLYSYIAMHMVWTYAGMQCQPLPLQDPESLSATVTGADL